MFQLSTVFVALAANACAAHVARPVEAAAVPVRCVGGIVQSAADAALYSACDSVSGDLRISAADLDDLSAFARLRHVTGKLEIVGNPALEDLSGLEQLEQVGALSIRDNGGLYQTAGLSSLTDVGELTVTNNSKLNSLRGLRSLSHAGSVEIRNNPRLSAFGMLPALARVDHDVMVSQNRGLSRLEVRGLLSRVEHNLSRPGTESVARLELH